MFVYGIVYYLHTHKGQLNYSPKSESLQHLLRTFPK
jgi:hypothetical protein